MPFATQQSPNHQQTIPYIVHATKNTTQMDNQKGKKYSIIQSHKKLVSNQC